MKVYVTGFVLALFSAFAGILSPSLPTGESFREPINLVWGFIYGFGWYIAGFAESIASPRVQTFGALVWPLIVLAGATYLFGRMLGIYTKRRAEIITVFTLSVLFILPQDIIMNTPLRHIPTYYSILSTVY